MAEDIVMKVSGVQGLGKALEDMTFRIDNASRRIVERGGLLIANSAKRQFRGDTHALPNPPRPTRRTGNLRDSIEVKDVTRVGPGSWKSSVGPTMIYGRRVELGGSSSYMTKKGTEVHVTTRPFPYLYPGFIEAKPRLVELYNSEYRKAIGK